ncbi:hypothetical protein [Rhodopirellula sp. P2]|uniref:hypothetical protein n=1 Tax=Rhodopirellula sp. P2 TaxID=2127060 RepID=UPI0023688A53|nr:hypothetical protein [Rhodopirellula sp. P2]WDQ15960.1 hypothetical protein PSR62_20320 [Rhodopirellula sp. P2]
MSFLHHMDRLPLLAVFTESVPHPSGLLMNVTRMTDLAPQYETTVNHSAIPIVVLVGIAIALVAIGGALTWHYRTREPEVPTSDALTMELCRAHCLPIYHRGLIVRLAAAAELPHTAEMFLSASHFDNAVAKAKQVVRLRRHHQSWLGEIRRTLFDS